MTTVDLTGKCTFVTGSSRGLGRYYALHLANVGSVAAHPPVHSDIIYAAAKQAVAHYTRCLAEQLRPYDVTVNGIAPAPTYTGRFLETRVVADQGERPRLQRVAQPEDMAQIVSFLAGASIRFPDRRDHRVLAWIVRMRLNGFSPEGPGSVFLAIKHILRDETQGFSPSILRTARGSAARGKREQG